MKTTKRPAKAKPVAKPAPNQWLKMAAASLDSLQANVFIANLDFEIIYINDCAKQTLGQIADEIRHAFGVEVDDILGSSIHTFRIRRRPRGENPLQSQSPAAPDRV